MKNNLFLSEGGKKRRRKRRGREKEREKAIIYLKDTAFKMILDLDIYTLNYKKIP